MVFEIRNHVANCACRVQTYLVITLTRQLGQRRHQPARGRLRNEFILLKRIELVCNLLNESSILVIRYQELCARHGLVLAESLLHLGHALRDRLLVLQQPLAHLRVRIRVQTLAHSRHALLQVAQRVECDRRDLHVGRDVAGAQVENVVQVAHALLDLTLGKSAP